MKSEEEIRIKLKDIEKNLSRLEEKWWITRSDAIQIEFHKNNIAFIKWALKDESDERFELARPITTAPNLLS